MQVPRPSARSHRSTSMTLTSSPSGEAAQESEPRATQLAWVSCEPCSAACKQDESAPLLLCIPGARCALYGSVLPVRDSSFLQQGWNILGCP